MYVCPSWQSSYLHLRKFIIIMYLLKRIMFIGKCINLSSFKQWYCSNNCKYLILKVELLLKSNYIYIVSRNCFSKEETIMRK